MYELMTDDFMNKNFQAQIVAESTAKALLQPWSLLRP